MKKYMKRETKRVVKYTKHNKTVMFDEYLRNFLAENFDKDMRCITTDK